MRRRPPTPPPSLPAAPADEKDPVGIEFGWKVHGLIQDWIKGVDAKSSITFAVIVGFGLFFSNQVFGDKGSLNGTVGDQLWAVRGTGIALGLAVACALYAVYPTLKRKRAKAMSSTGLIYFGHLRHRSAQEIETALAGLDNEQILKQLASQIEATSDLAWKKHARLQAAQLMLVLALIGFVLTLTVFAP